MLRCVINFLTYVLCFFPPLCADVCQSYCTTFSNKKTVRDNNVLCDTVKIGRHEFESDFTTEIITLASHYFLYIKTCQPVLQRGLYR